ncbi:MAG: PKD domain-containing protein [Nanoarchaeota archaeon]|nr:PKD domain-containing protein [Nanoarchaeota archaeon]
MKRNIALLVTIFLIFPYIAFSITTFVVQETEKISLQANATDPDADKLVTTYTAPLNEKGEWQTSYGDADEYKSTITVSDGVTSDSKEVLIIVKKKEEAPKIESFIPKQDILSIKESDSIDFRVLASDLNSDELSYGWFLDDKKAKDGQEFSYAATYNDAGNHKISAAISDGTTSVSKEWQVNVANVDVEGLLNEIKDVTVAEDEIARLELPDFEKYGLTYSISEPVGNKNEWKTSYKDAGTYDIKVHAEGKGFTGDKIVKATVNDFDRAPVFENTGNKILNENEELKITLNANDPDGDEITFSANNLPEGAKLEGNVFTWKSGYDAVKKEGFVDIVMDKFRVLSKSFYVQFIASSKDKKIVQNIIIAVKDVNRAPVLEELEAITINEGEIVKIVPKAYDLDGDKLSLSYSGFIDTDTFKSSFDDSGTYYVKATASDGLLETLKFVQITIKQSNRAPLFGKIEEIRAREGDSIALLVDAYDPDGDELTYSLDNPPEGSSLKGNAFLWMPIYDTATKKETKKFDLVFVASDGKAQTRQIAKVEIADKNRAPKITDATKSITAKVNEPVLLFVKATDEDGDELTYTWNFGLLEKYKATSNHQRIFTSKGLKTIKVTVSDGIDEVGQIINVNVV